MNTKFSKIILAIVAIFACYMLGNAVSHNSAAPMPSTPRVEQVITYQSTTVDEMVDVLDKNPMQAESLYQGKYFEITGRVCNIDSDGEYISIEPASDPWAFDRVQCFMRNDSQRQCAMNVSIGEIITVRGYVSAVGEVLGFQMDLTENFG